LGILLLIVIVPAVAGCKGGIFRQFEYDEDIYLSLDGSATIDVNGSLPALRALRGFDVSLNPNARFDRERIAEQFSGPVTRVVRVTSSRQHGRRFAHVRIEVADIHRLPTSPAFAWARVRFERMGDLYRYREDLGPSTNLPVGNVGWTGGELVAFRLHLPSKIVYHNAGEDNLRRGNILVWEQPLQARLAGEPVEMEVRMEPTSILYWTLWLFAGSMLAAFSLLGLIILWVVKRGKDRLADTTA
jgi:hypothetical protein